MRRYKYGPNGEQPVWASKRKLIALGIQEGREAFRDGREPIRLSNPTHDDAARKEYKRLKEAAR
jgi:hypothetical protein